MECELLLDNRVERLALKPTLTSHAYKVTLASYEGLPEREVILAGFSKHGAEIDAVDLNINDGYGTVKSVEQLHDFVKYFIAFPSLVARAMSL